jgi:hypothetical protein
MSDSVREHRGLDHRVDGHCGGARQAEPVGESVDRAGGQSNGVTMLAILNKLLKGKCCKQIGQLPAKVSGGGIIGLHSSGEGTLLMKSSFFGCAGTSVSLSAIGTW